MILRTATFVIGTGTDVNFFHGIRSRTPKAATKKSTTNALASPSPTSHLGGPPQPQHSASAALQQVAAANNRKLRPLQPKASPTMTAGGSSNGGGEHTSNSSLSFKGKFYSYYSVSCRWNTYRYHCDLVIFFVHLMMYFKLCNVHSVNKVTDSIKILPCPAPQHCH